MMSEQEFFKEDTTLDWIYDYRKNHNLVTDTLGFSGGWELHKLSSLFGECSSMWGDLVRLTDGKTDSIDDTAKEVRQIWSDTNEEIKITYSKFCEAVKPMLEKWDALFETTLEELKSGEREPKGRE